MVIRNYLGKFVNRIMDPQNGTRYELLCYVAFCVLLIVSLFVKACAFLNFLVCACLLLFAKNESLFRWLLFAFPFAVVFKMEPDSSSFFTYLELLAVFLICVRAWRKLLAPVVLAVLGVLALEMAAGIHSLQGVVTILKAINGLLLLYFFAKTCDPSEACSYFWPYIAGMLSSSVLGMFKLKIPRFLAMYYGEVDYVRVGSKQIMRFEGIFNDPNYFSISAILCVSVCMMAFMTRMVRKEKTTPQHWALLCGCCLFFVVAGFATVSKSFLGLFVIVTVVLILALPRQWLGRLLQKVKWKYVLPIGVVVLIMAAVIDPFHMFSAIISRLTSSNVLTGRGAIWVAYWKACTESVGAFLMGHGIDAALVNGRAAHNMLLETIYYIGLVGLILYITAIVVIVRSNRRVFSRKLVNYLGFVAVVMSFLFLCGLNRVETPFYWIVAYLLYSVDFGARELLL